MEDNLAVIISYGDPHLSSKPHGAHVNYPEESLYYYKKITEVAEEVKATHIIGTGDLTFGRFHTLEYRKAVETELKKQSQLVNGNHYEVKGNHDSATYGMTEYEYYIENGLLKPSTNLQIGNVNISMVDYGKEHTANVIIEDNKTNIIVAHNYFKFKDTRLPNYGKAIELDSFIDWFGVDYLICGHIHKNEIFEGSIIKDGYSHKTVVHYLGCPARPAYREGHMDEYMFIDVLTIKADGSLQYDIRQEPLWSLSDSFNLAQKEEEQQKKEEKENRVDISDIVAGLNTHERTVGNPEDIIKSLLVDEKYKEKAIELLKLGRA